MAGEFAELEVHSGGVSSNGFGLNWHPFTSSAAEPHGRIIASSTRLPDTTPNAAREDGQSAPLPARTIL